MAQSKVNGSVTEGQFLTGTLTHYIVDEVDGDANIASFGYTAGSANPGELVVEALSTIVNPVIVESANARVMYFAAEVEGHTAATIQEAVRDVTGYANITVATGTYTVV